MRLSHLRSMNFDVDAIFIFSKKINPKLEFEDLWNTLFADDAALVSTEEPSLQILVTIFNEVASAFGLTVSVEKSLILHQKKYTNKQFDEVKKEYREAKKKKQEKKSGILITHKPLTDVCTTRYLGSMFNKAGDLDTEITKRHGVARASYDELRKSVFKSKNINLEAKGNYIISNMTGVLTRLCGSVIIGNYQSRS